MTLGNQIEFSIIAPLSVCGICLFLGAGYILPFGLAHLAHFFSLKLDLKPIYPLSSTAFVQCKFWGRIIVHDFYLMGELQVVFETTDKYTILSQIGGEPALLFLSYRYSKKGCWRSNGSKKVFALYNMFKIKCVF